MKYVCERIFLENLNITSIYFDEFLTFNVLNDIEKKIMYYVFRKLSTSHLRGFYFAKKIHLLQDG